MADEFNVSFTTDEFNVVFGEQGPQGRAGSEAISSFDLETTYIQGQLTRTDSNVIYLSLIDNNLGNPLSDTDAWVVVTSTQVIDTLAALTDTNIAATGNPLVNGQVLTWDGTELEWINTASSGGNTPINPNKSKIGISLSPNNVKLSDSGATLITGSLSLTSGYTFVNSTITATDVRNDPITVNKTSNSAFTFDVSNTTEGTIHVNVSATVNKTDGDVDYTDVAQATIRVSAEWYTGLLATQPTALSQMTDEGAYNSPESHTFTAAADGVTGYVAVPTEDSQTYTFTSGNNFLSTTNLGTLSANWTLFRLDDFSGVVTNNFITFTVARN